MCNGGGHVGYGKGLQDTRDREVYKYQVTQSNSETGEGGFFVHCINTFLKL